MGMKPYDIYIFFLCFIVFTALTALFSFLIYEIIKLTVKLIKHGVEDEQIIAEYKKPAKSAAKKVFSKFCSIALSVVLLICFIFSIWLHLSENTFSAKSSLKVVASSSMAEKNKNNKYLFNNNLDNQLNMFDLIVVHPAPKEEELKLYDIVVYQYEDIYVVHRIVDIIEPNQETPHRQFVTQGDAVGAPDKELVTYEQIKAIYNNERIQFVGSFVFFMRSPAGWLCVLLVLFAIIATPIVEKRIDKEIKLRLREIGVIDDKEKRD